MRFLVWLIIAPLAFLASGPWVLVTACVVIHGMYTHPKLCYFYMPDWSCPLAPGAWMYALLDRVWPRESASGHAGRVIEP